MRKLHVIILVLVVIIGCELYMLSFVRGINVSTPSSTLAENNTTPSPCENNGTEVGTAVCKRINEFSSSLSKSKVADVTILGLEHIGTVQKVQYDLTDKDNVTYDLSFEIIDKENRKFLYAVKKDEVVILNKKDNAVVSVGSIKDVADGKEIKLVLYRSALNMNYSYVIEILN